VAAARAASLPEVCGDAALLFDPADPTALSSAMRSLLEDGALRQQLRARGRTRARQFSWDRSAARLLQAIGQPGGQAPSQAGA
jgi:glycosyltransferase involved in cell wall biosynthesis